MKVYSEQDWGVNLVEDDDDSFVLGYNAKPSIEGHRV